MEGGVNLLQRASGFFNFWNKLTPSYCVLADSSISFYNGRTSPDLKPSIRISLDTAYEVVQLSDYPNGVGIRTQREMLVEFICPDEAAMFKWMKQLIKNDVLNHMVQKSAFIGRRNDFAALVRAVLLLKRYLRRQIRVRMAVRIQAMCRMHVVRLGFQETRRKVIVVQSVVRRHQTRRLVNQLKLEQLIAKHQPHRTRVVMEIYATESSYVQQLDQMIKVFMKPMRALEKKAGVTHEQINIIFGNVEEIVEKHRGFYEELGEIVEGWSESSLISQPFVKMSEWLNIYIPYCNNFDDAKSMLARCQKIPAFHSFIETVDAVKTLKRLDINSFLILPIQRIPRYELLLKDLIKRTWETHPDYDNLSVALTKIKEAAKLLNRAKSYNESKHRIASIQSHIHSPRQLTGQPSAHSLGSMRLDSGGNQLEQKYVGEGTLTYQELRKVPVKRVKSMAAIQDIDDLLQDEGPEPEYSYEKEGKEATVYAFLFNDTLVLTRRLKQGDLVKLPGRSGTFRYQHFMNISLDHALIESAEDKKDLSFILLTGDERLHKLTAENVEVKKKWLNDIQEALDSLATRQESQGGGAGDISDFLVEESNEGFNDNELKVNDRLSSISNQDLKGKDSLNTKDKRLFAKLFKSSETLDVKARKKG